MSEDERLAKIKELLDSTLAEFESVFKSASGFDESRVGNGWIPSSVPVKTYMMEPMPLDEAERIAESRKTRSFGPAWLRSYRSNRISRIGKPILVFFPYWRTRGYHECFYFRRKSYRANVAEDVIAVQVGGRIRPLTSEAGASRSILKRIIAIARRVLFARPERRYFTVDGATELAYQYTEGSLILDRDGGEDIEMEYLLEKKPEMHPLEERGEREDQPASAQFTPLSFKAEDVVSRLHSKIVRPPQSFSKILTNRFEVTELQLLQLPVYVFHYKYLRRERTLRVHGVTGELLK